jgi:hypothetical protein
MKPLVLLTPLLFASLPDLFSAAWMKSNGKRLKRIDSPITEKLRFPGCAAGFEVN